MYIGIDAGAYSLVMSYIDKNGESVLVKDHNGREEYRGVFIHGKNRDGQIKECFGNEAVRARSNYLHDPSAICRSVKLVFGNSETPETDSVTVGGKKFNVAALMEKLLTDFLKVKSTDIKNNDNVSLKLGEKDTVCLGVPVKYNGRKRALLKALLINALKNADCLQRENELPEIKIASEPVLGTVGNNYVDAYTALKKDGKVADNESVLKRMKKDKLVLTFDMGHSTFDTTLLVPNPDKNGEPYIQLASDGIAGSAGEAVTLAVMKLIADKAGLAMPEENTKAYLDLYKQAEDAKIAFGECSDESDMLNFEGMLGKHYYSVDISKPEFNEAIKGTVEKNVELCAKLYEDAVFNPKNEGLLRGFNTDKSKFADLEIQLIGGSSCLNLVCELIRQKFAWLDERNIKLIRPKNAVAYGAAVLASDDSVLRTTSFGYAVKASFNPTLEDVLKFLKLPELKVAAEYVAKDVSFINNVKALVNRDKLIKLILTKAEDNGIDFEAVKQSLISKYAKELRERARYDEKGYFHGLVGVITSNAKNKETEYVSSFKPVSASATSASFEIYELEHISCYGEHLPVCAADGHTVDDCASPSFASAKSKFSFEYNYSERPRKANPDLTVDLKVSVNPDGMLCCVVKERYGSGVMTFSQDNYIIHVIT